MGTEQRDTCDGSSRSVQVLEVVGRGWSKDREKEGGGVPGWERAGREWAWGSRRCALDQVVIRCQRWPKSE